MEEARELQAEEQTAGVAVGTIIAPVPAMKGRTDDHVTFIRPFFLGLNRRYLGYFAMVLLVMGAGFFMIAGSRLFDNKSGAVTVQPGADAAAPVSITANSPAPDVRAAGNQAGLAASPQQLAEAKVRQMVMQWAEAWSRRDAAAYLAFYADDFNLPEGMLRADWEAQRQSRLHKYRSIEVTLKNVKISYSGGDAASVRFTQNFRADSYREKGTQKELHLKNIQSRWFIVSEKNSPD
jgi:ketosteroid isomerase-like protein